MEHPALACFARRAEPRARLVCFPHAGGGAHAFATWGELLPEWVEVHAVAYAGRGPRLKEPFAEDWRSLIAECAAAVRTVADRPVALFGHSFGATVAVSLLFNGLLFAASDEADAVPVLAAVAPRALRHAKPIKR